MLTFVILHSLSVSCIHTPCFHMVGSRNLTLAIMRPPCGFTSPLKPWCLPSRFSAATLTRIPLPVITVSSPYLCLCLMGSPCFDLIADVVQSHGGVFMDSSYPSSPVTGPPSRGQRRASEVSIASQVSGMADSYTATNIANSKCSQYQQVSRSLFLTLRHTHWFHSSYPLSLSLSFSLTSVLSLFPTFLPNLFSLNYFSLTLHTRCTAAGAVYSQPGRHYEYPAPFATFS